MEREIIEEKTYDDRSGWGPGPWDNEPDKIHWIDKDTDMDCLIVRGPLGALCGYVAVTKGHPLFEVPYMDTDIIDLEVHGGLTFSDFCIEDGHICHVPQKGRPEKVWWLGFDCGHAYDILPGAPEGSRLRDGVSPESSYKTEQFVSRECNHLARQLKDVT